VPYQPHQDYKGDALTAGLGGGSKNACVALGNGQNILGICEQERITRVRAAGVNSTGLPDEALDFLLRRIGRSRNDIERFVLAEDGAGPNLQNKVHIGHHFAHACTSYLSSLFTSSVIVICDHEFPKVSVWNGCGSELTPVDMPWAGMGFSELYSECAELLEFGYAADQRFEALARLNPDHRDSRLDKLFRTDGVSLQLEPGWKALAAEWFVEKSATSRASYAAALQSRVGELLLEFLARVRHATQSECLCLGGSLFYHSSFNSLVKTSGLFSRVFVPVNPGNAGLAVGAVLQQSGCSPKFVSPFLGPAYTMGEIKATLENCKLPYKWVGESTAIEMAVDALCRGSLVGWYEGGMEWGQRALGARSILASPFAPYVLENLNRFLKWREPWRGYALSTLESAVEPHFTGPAEAPFMECDFRPRDAEIFRHFLPSPAAAIRVHSAGPNSPPRFCQLLAAFGAANGIPCLVNTSFNGFHEPIVCSPRDAIRVFYGTGVDVLFLDGFVVGK
jgi:carbamoyltransferase